MIPQCFLYKQTNKRITKLAQVSCLSHNCVAWALVVTFRPLYTADFHQATVLTGYSMYVYMYQYNVLVATWLMVIVTQTVVTVGR